MQEQNANYRYFLKKYMKPEEIKEARRILGLNQSEFGNIFGVKQNTVSAWEKGKSEPEPKLVPKLYEILNSAKETIAVISKDEIPMMAWCAAGHGGQEIPIDWQDTLKIPGVSITGTYALKVVSDSMVNVIFPGDILICREVPIKMVRHGFTYVFVTDEGTTVKQYFLEHGKVRLHSYNRNVADFYPEQIFKGFEILRLIHEYREVETFEFSDSLNEINGKLEILLNKGRL